MLYSLSLETNPLDFSLFVYEEFGIFDLETNMSGLSFSHVTQNTCSGHMLELELNHLNFALKSDFSLIFLLFCFPSAVTAVQVGASFCYVLVV